MAKKINHGSGAGRGSHVASQCLRSGQRRHRQYIDRHRSAGRARGTWNTKQWVDPAARASDEYCYSWKHQSHPIPKEFDTANACNSTERAGLPEIVGC